MTNQTPNNHSTQSGQDFADRDQNTLAHYTDSLAGQLDKFSQKLRDREIGSLLDDAKQLAHRQPELFVAGALAAGFVLGRFFKSSRRSSRAYQSAYQYDYPRDYPYDDSYGDYSYGPGEFDPRDPTRRYGEPYGQRYGDTLSSSPGPEYSHDYDAGYRPGFQGEYGARYDDFFNSRNSQSSKA